MFVDINICEDRFLGYCIVMNNCVTNYMQNFYD